MKWSMLGLPEQPFYFEQSVLIIYAFLSWVRIKSGIRGNKIESLGSTLLMVLLGLITLTLNIYYLQF